MAARRLLNRAVSTSLCDATFMAEARRLADTDPDALLAAIVSSASLDVEQAELVHGLLRQLPALLAHRDDESHPCLLHHLRVALEQTLPSARQRAVVLFMARLTQATEPSTAADGTRATEASSEDEPTLVSRDALLAVVLLPLLRWDGSGAPGAVLEATLQVLSARSVQLTAQQLPTRAKERPLGTAVLAAVLGALLELLEIRGRFAVETADVLLRCTHATVQLLLPRARASAAAGAAASAEPSAAKASASWLSVAHQQWPALSWRTQLYVWPLADRMCTSAGGGGGGGGKASRGPSARASAGARLAQWIRHAARPASAAEALCALVLAAAVPGLPVRQALPALLEQPTTTAAAVTAPTPDDVVAALASGLAQGGATEWRYAASQLLPVLATRGLLPEVAPDVALPPPTASAGALPVPMPEAEADCRSVRAAHCLLLAMRTQLASHVAPGAMGATELAAAELGAVMGTAEAQRRALVYATGFAKWLSASAQECTDPLCAAHLLGVALRVSALAPAATAERYFVVRLHMQHRLLELLPAGGVAEMSTCGAAELALVETCVARVDRALCAV